MTHKDCPGCPACPTNVRALYAAAHNAVNAVRMAFEGVGDKARAVRKLQELAEEVEHFRPVVERHFGDHKEEESPLQLTEDRP